MDFQRRILENSGTGESTHWPPGHGLAMGETHLSGSWTLKNIKPLNHLYVYIYIIWMLLILIYNVGIKYGNCHLESRL